MNGKKQQDNKLLKKPKYPEFSSDLGWIKLIPCLKRTLQEILSLYIHGFEGFSCWKAGIDTESESILLGCKIREMSRRNSS